MESSFDGIQFAHYVRRRWNVILISCFVAIAITGVVCAFLPKQYTATASILIEPPAGNDPRGATAVSPVYLESLKTYERLASSDTVFATAVRELGLQNTFANTSIEAIKRSVLKVSRPTSTKIVEISATLRDPQSAQRLAHNIAQQSVALNRRLNNQSTEEVLAEGKRTMDAAAGRVRAAQQAKDDVVRTQAIEPLDNEVTGINELRVSVETDLGKARAELADMEAQTKTFHPGDGLEAQAQWTVRQIDALRARIVSLEAQARVLGKSAGEKTTELEARKLRREFLDVELRSARADYELARTKVSDAQASAAYRGERLEIMDPGIVPQRPSSPNIPLNLMLALLLSVIASLTYLAVCFGYGRVQRRTSVPEYSLR